MSDPVPVRTPFIPVSSATTGFDPTESPPSAPTEPSDVILTTDNVGQALDVADMVVEDMGRSLPLLSMAADVTGMIGNIESGIEMFVALCHAVHQGTEDGLLSAAFPTHVFSGAADETYAYAAGVRAVLAGAAPQTIAQVRDGLHGEAVRRKLDEGIQAAERERGTPGFDLARDRYRKLVGQLQVGIAAGLEGWSRASVVSRGPLALHAYDEVRRLLAAGDPATLAQRRSALEAKQEGFLDAAHDHVDPARYDADASYRSGVWQLRKAAEHGQKLLHDWLERAKANEQHRRDSLAGSRRG